MDKLNIAELLKDCPSGMELDCTMYEDVYFDYVDELQIIHCYIQRELCKTSITFNQYGTPNSDIKSKCVIFPKDKTTWKCFQRPFKDGDIVTCKDGSALVACIYRERRNTSVFSYYIALYKSGLGIIEDGEISLTDDCLCFASEEEKLRLFAVIKENGYKWNTETKTLEKLVKPKFKVGDKIKQMGSDRHYIIKNIEFDRYILNNNQFLRFTDEHIYELAPNKFDITTLKPFDKVLVRLRNTDHWKPAFWGRRIQNHNFPFITSYGSTAQAIPFKGNEWIVGTTEDCSDYYKTWI